jgi:hypothetical protein
LRELEGYQIFTNKKIGGKMNPKLTKEQASILGAYTGILCGNFGDFHKYAEKILGRPIWTHEFASEKFVEELKQKSKKDFLSICPEDDC